MKREEESCSSVQRTVLQSIVVGLVSPSILFLEAISKESW